MELVGFDEIDETDEMELHGLIEEHHLRTLSPVAARILESWDEMLSRFKKVMPHDYKRALAEMAEAERAMDARQEAGAVADPVGVPHTGTASQA
jgi:glutamate synthase domain-containing protein 3